MEVLHDTGRRAWPGQGAASVLTVGAYDGVHLGHRAVIAEVRRRAAPLGLRSVVVTFDRHPASVVRPESAPPLLTDLDQKLELLAGTGIDAALVVAFDQARAREPAEEFVREVLVATLAAAQVVVGTDFHFGHHRRGDVAMLERLGAEWGFEAVGLDLVGGHGTASGAPVDSATGAQGSAGIDASGRAKVSSTGIRRALVAGEVVAAREMLGRPYEVRGVSVDGPGPAVPGTTSVSVPGEILVPGPGRYSGRVARTDAVPSPDSAPVPVSISVGGSTPRRESRANLVELTGVEVPPGERLAILFDDAVGASGPIGGPGLGTGAVAHPG